MRFFVSYNWQKERGTGFYDNSLRLHQHTDFVSDYSLSNEITKNKGDNEWDPLPYMVSYVTDRA